MTPLKQAINFCGKAMGHMVNERASLAPSKNWKRLEILLSSLARLFKVQKDRVQKLKT